MTLYTLFVLCLTLYPVKAAYQDENLPCNGHQANFDLHKLIGLWHVIGIIPDKGYPFGDILTCYMMEVSETDEAGLRWLVGREVNVSQNKLIHKIRGTLIRQRYYSPRSFDIWSKSVTGINGCFRQLFSLGTNKTTLADAENLTTHMQLHFIESPGGPLLVQILWGRMISAIVYRKEEGASWEWLDPVEKFMTDLKGEHRPILRCMKPLEPLVPPPNERP